MKYLGIDFGFKKVGLAISEGVLPSPYKIIKINSLSDVVGKIVQLIRSESFDKVIVGLPEGEMGKATTKFVELLRKRGVVVETTDETLSSRQALKSMIAAGIGKKKRRMEDDVAAAIILQNYLDTLK